LVKDCYYERSLTRIVPHESSPFVAGCRCGLAWEVICKKLLERGK
jgi:hypothetical protein